MHYCRRWRTGKQIILALIGTVTLLSTSGCLEKTAHVPAPTAASPSDSSYTDLRAGGRLRIVVPLLDSGSYPVLTESKETQGNTMVLSAGNLLGYEVSHYSIEGRADGRVRLRFQSA